MLQIYLTICLFSDDMVFMTTKINLRQFVIFTEPWNIDTADIK